jgi:hypothetical protein
VGMNKYFKNTGFFKSSALKMEASGFSRTLPLYQTTRRCIPEDSTVFVAVAVASPSDLTH